MRAIMILCALLIEIFSMASRAEEDTWTKKANMPTARLWLSTSVVDGIIYAIGGAGGVPSPIYRSVEAYDPAADIWVKKADMPTARSCFSTSVVDGVIYAIGGMFDVNTPLSTVEAYDPATDTWTTKADMPTSRMWLSTSVVDGIIYAIGGKKLFWAVGTSVSAVEAYNPVTDTWAKKADMPMVIDSLSTSVVDGIIYAIGGWNEEAGFSSAVSAYDPKMDTWTPKEDMPTGRFWLSTSVVNGIIYAFGGYSGQDSNICFPTVEAYNPAEDTWTQKADMPRAIAGLSTSVVNGRIYAIGGGFQSVPTHVVEEYDPGSIAVEPRGKFTTTWAAIKYQ